MLGNDGKMNTKGTTMKHTLTLLTALLLALLGTARGADAAAKPNIILCMTDDQGWGDVRKGVSPWILPRERFLPKH